MQKSPQKIKNKTYAVDLHKISVKKQQLFRGRKVVS